MASVPESHFAIKPIKNPAMKKTLALFLALFTAMSTLVSCKNSSDEPESLSTPVYEQHAAKFEVTTPSSEYKSIELTSSGNYIIVLKGDVNYSPRRPQGILGAMRHSVLLNGTMKTRAWFDDIVEGKYSIDENGDYILANYGRIRVEMEGDTVACITIIFPDGTEKVIRAAMRNQLPESTMTNNLCRTWNADKIGLAVKVNGEKFKSERPAEQFNLLIKELNEWLVKTIRNKYPEFTDDDDDFEFDEDDLFDDEEMVKQIIFSKSGTYMVKYKNNSLALATWSWIDEKRGRLRYSWDYGDMYDDDAAGLVNVSFEDNGMVIREVLMDDYDDGDLEDFPFDIQMTIIWKFRQ